jgi:EmrB/QacA subfamily drug resistance transporter
VPQSADTGVGTAAKATGMVLLTLASAQFLMTLDSTVMNVSIATVAKDIGTTITGIQTAITLYTLVMAMFMITGGKLGKRFGRKRAFAVGCVIYGAGSFTTAIAPNLTVLIIGWSFLEGIGAALIMPAIVALVASNFGVAQRPRAYGIVMAAGAVAVALGPLIGGMATTYFSWRWVLAGEVVVVLVILVLARRVQDTSPTSDEAIDRVGAVLSATGIGLIVFGILRSGDWGWVRPTTGGPTLVGVSPVLWLIAGGGVVLWLFTEWERHVVSRGREPLVQLAMFENRQLTGGLLMFLSQFLVQAGVFFTIPLFLSVALGLSAMQTGLRIMPLSVTLVIAAMGIPRFFPHASPRRVVRLGLGAMILGILVLVLALDPKASASIVTAPLLLLGLGIGALASQLGSVTVSSVPDEQSSEVGGLQNTASNLGASIGTALAGSILIAALTTSFLNGLANNPDVPDEVVAQANVELAAGVPFISDADLQTALDDAGVPQATADAVITVNEQARIDGLGTALSVLALLGIASLFFSGRLPNRQPADLLADAVSRPDAASSAG